VEQRREAACPVLGGKVDRIDTGGGHRGRSTLRTLLHAPHTSGIDDVGTSAPAQADQEIPVAVAQPEAVLGADGAGGSDHGVCRGRVFEIDRQLEVGAARLVHVSERRNVGTDSFTSHRAEGSPDAAVPDDAVMVQHGVTVLAQPDVGLESGCSQVQGQGECFEGIVGAVRSPAAVRERDRRRAQRRQWRRGHTSIVPLVPAIWLLPIVAFGVLTVVSIVMIRRLAMELRATAQSLASIADVAAAVRADVMRARAAIDSLDVPSLRQATAERALGMAIRWVTRRALPF